MERSCDFCAKLRPVVFCEADAAHLCLPCDLKVHSANALSKRHQRVLICESCKNHPAYSRCADHRMFMCQACDRVHHDLSSKHKKQVIFTYTGCPSAKELAKEWGFDPSDLESNNVNSQIGGSSVVSSIESLRSNVSEEYEVRSGNSHIKGNKRENNSVVWQQVRDLRKLQLTEGSYRFSKSEQEQVDASSRIANTGWKMTNNDNRHEQDPDFQLDGNLGEGMTSKPSSLFSQMNHLADLLNGDNFWQSKDPVQSNQLWSQNMQNLGVCDELRGMDDLNMPDFDLTFQNYEELFEGEEEPKRTLINDKNNTCFGSPIDFANSQEQYCNSTEIGGRQLDVGETAFTRHKDKKASRHEKQAGYASYRMKPDAMKRVKSKVWKAEGSDTRDTNIIMSNQFLISPVL